MDFKKALDRGFYRAPIPIYGSCAKGETVPFTYMGTMVVSSNDPITDSPVDSIFEVERFPLFTRGVITQSMLRDFRRDSEDDENHAFWLPVIMSMTGYTEKTSEKPSSNTLTPIRFRICGFERNDRDYNDVKNPKSAADNTLKGFVGLWNPWRLEQQSEWLLIGEAYFNIYEGSNEGISSWKTATQVLIDKRLETLNRLGLDMDGKMKNTDLLDHKLSTSTSSDVDDYYNGKDRDRSRTESCNDNSKDRACSDDQECGRAKRPKFAKKSASTSRSSSRTTLSPEEEILNRIYDNDQFKVPRLIDLTERNKLIKQKRTAEPSYIKASGDALYRKHYYAFSKGRCTIRAVADNAREDDPVAYAALHQNWCKRALEDSTSNLDTDIALALYRYLWLDWMCETIKDGQYEYYYMGLNKLNIDRGKQKLKKIIVEEFVNIFYRMKLQVGDEKESAKGDNKLKGDELVNKINEVIKKLKTAGVKKRLIEEAAIFFDTPNANTFFNENCELTCVNTGVLVASTSGIVFRKGRLEDFITKRTTAFYLDDITKDDIGVVKIMAWSNETFLRKQDMVVWWWKFHSSLLRGGNDDKIFPFIHGEKGNEGKSAWARLFDSVLGDYCSHVEINYLTDTPKDSNSATPVTSSLRGVRAVYIEEAQSARPIISGPFKKKTGKDKIRTRGLFQEGGPMTFQATLIGAGNDAPTFSDAGLPVKERLVIVPMRAQRDSSAPEDLEEQYRVKKFKRDNFFDQEIEFYGAVTLWILVQYYAEYVAHGLRPYPEQMVKHTERYWEEKDKYHCFTRDMINVTKLDHDLLTIDQLYEVFKEWYERMYPKTRIPNNDELRRELRNRWGKMKNGKFMGVAFKKAQRSNTQIINNEDGDVEEFN
jgi:phage/plasmid-associated DNA primase